MKKIIVIVLSALLISGCGNVELKNGENAIVTFKDGEGISSNDLYDVLKEMYGVDYLVNLIDTALLENEYDETNEEKEYVEQVVDAVKSETGEEFLQQIQYYYNVKTEEEFRDYIKLNYRRGIYIEDYSETTVTDKQIKEYYDDVAVGDMEISHILITSTASSTATEEEKDKKETEAFNKAKDIISRLDNGEDFATLAKELSEDSASGSEGGSLGKINYGQNYDEDFMDAAAKLEVGKYSKTPVKTQFGYHIIYKKSQDEKDTLENLEDSIRNIIAKEVVSTNPNIYLEALEFLRSKYEMDIVDSDLKNGYEDYLKNIKSGN